MRDYAYFGQMGWKTRLLNALRGIFRLPPLERWIRNRTIGKEAGSIWVKLMPPEHGYRKGSWREVERNGLKYRLDISNSPDHCEYFGYIADAHQILIDLVKADSIVIDIGANIGLLAMDLARKAHHGMVIAYEPDPDNYARLGQHVSLNGLTNIIARPFAIGPEETVHKLYQVVESNSGMNRIILQGEDLSRFPYKEVRVLPLSKGLEGLPVKKVDVIKIDVEGFEQNVLKGCEDIIRRDRPVLFVELDDDNLLENGGSARSLINYLASLDYDVLDAVKNAPVPPGQDLTHCHFDILCVSKASAA